MDDRSVSPVVGVTLLIALVVALAATAFVFVTQFDTGPASAPQVKYTTETETISNCEFTIVEATDGGGGLLFYRQNGERVYVDDDGDGQTEAGENVRVPPGQNPTLIVQDENKTFVAGEVTGRNITNCLSATGSGQPGVRTTHSVRYDVGGGDGSGTIGNSLNEIVVTYESGSGVDMSAVEPADVAAAGFDRDGDGAIDVSALSSPDDLQGVSASNGGRAVQFQFTGNYNVKAQDVLIVRWGDGMNPSTAGTYDVTVNINGDESKTGNITVG